jgi:FADH2 O2-dependent halogenase
MGFALTLAGVSRMAECIDRSWGTAEFLQELRTYSAQTEADFLVAEQLIAALYVNADDFELFSALSLLYFVAVTHAEASWRLGRPRLAYGWLLHRHPRFGPEAKACTDTAMRQLTWTERAALLDRILATVALVDVAGLSRRERRNWYPAEASDLLAAAEKLGATRSEIDGMLERTGFVPSRGQGFKRRARKGPPHDWPRDRKARARSVDRARAPHVTPEAVLRRPPISRGSSCPHR